MGIEEIPPQQEGGADLPETRRFGDRIAGARRAPDDLFGGRQPLVGLAAMQMKIAQSDQRLQDSLVETARLREVKGMLKGGAGFVGAVALRFDHRFAKSDEQGEQGFRRNFRT